MMTSPIVCTPDICGGQPRLEGTGLNVEFVVGRFAAGESLAELVEDYGILTWEVEAMVRAVCAAAYSQHRGMLTLVYRRLVAQAKQA